MDTKISKYGNDYKYESPIDTRIFFPISDLFMDSFRKIGFTPNGITLLSTILQLLSIYYFVKHKPLISTTLYLLGYIMDCMDGRMARKYNMYSKIGEVFDMVSDNVVNYLLLYFLYKKLNGLQNKKFLLIFSLGILLSLYYSHVEALSCVKQNTEYKDDFYKMKYDKFKDGLIYIPYLILQKLTYITYRSVQPSFNVERLDKTIGVLKYFGPGTFTCFIAYFLYNN
jgi:phosphatidylglycerophosphate synthase